MMNRVEGGLQFRNKLTYLNWEPGGEYTQTLTIKNIKLTTQKLKFKLSCNQFTSPVCHQPLILCAGTSYTLPVTFRPSGKNPCEGFIQFQTNDGENIKIPIRAVLSCPKLALTEHLKFGMCAVRSCISINFEISNIGNVPTSFSWRNPQVFQIHPKNGRLEPNETCRLCATFCPDFAKVYSSHASCIFGDKEGLNNLTECNLPDSVEMKIVKMEGIGKYPYVVVKGISKSDSVSSDKQITELHSELPKEVIVNFGDVAVGRSTERWIDIANPSPVSCILLVRPYITSDTSFKTSYTSVENEKTLEPQGSTRVKLIYTPRVLSRCTDIGYFIVEAQGGCGSTRVKCTGRSLGPNVKIENEHGVTNFGTIEIGKTSTGFIHLKNNSDVSAIFQIQIDQASVFFCDNLCGTMEPFSNTSVLVKFTPQHAIPYCRTIPVVVHNQEPLFVHFIGTGFSEIQVPVRLQANDIVKYLVHAKTGVSLLPPERLKELVEKGMLKAEATSDILQSSSRSVSCLPQPQAVSCQSNCDKYMFSGKEMSTVPHITCDVEEIEFGYCSPSFSSDGKTIIISNHTYGEVSCVWMTDNLRSFEVVPPERTILPRRSASFIFYFKPDKPCQFYDVEVECYIFYKELKNCSRVDPLAITPPWCVTVHLSGHAFNKDFGVAVPEASFYSEDAVFPPTIVGQSVYQTVLIRKSTGKEPTTFKVIKDDKVFIAKPSNGILKNDFQLILIQMIPREAKVYDHVVKCQLNSTGVSYLKSFSLFGSGEVPKLSLGNKGQLCFKPTCIGTTSCQNYSVRNSSGIPLWFEWKHPVTKGKAFYVEPTCGLILPNEIQEHRWCFSPVECKPYEMKSVLHSSLSTPDGLSGGSHIRSKAVLEVLGIGSLGIIQCSPATYDFGVMIVGTSKYCHISLSNAGSCDLNFCLSVTSQNGDIVPSGVMELNPVQGTIFARSNVHIKVTVRPGHGESYYSVINYTLTSPSKETDECHEGATLVSSTLCEISFVGVFPSMKIIDIQGLGVASRISKAALWEMLSIDRINESLNEVPLNSELRYSIGSRHSLRHTISTKARTVIDCDFGAAPLNSESCNISLVLKNDCAVTTQWAFLMSSDVWLEPDMWADYGHLDEAEKNESHVLKNDLFVISPKKGCLESNSHVSITMTYKHSHVGTNKLPIFLKINNGRELVLNLSGVTVDKGCPYLHIGCKEHLFDPVPIGIHSYPRQVFPLYNGGDTVIGYEIDLGVLTHLTKENFSMPIFECLEPAGYIPPATTLPLEFVFSPIEAKRYSIDVPIYLSTGVTTVVTLTGVGYIPQKRNCQPGQVSGGIDTGSVTSPQNVVTLSHENLDFGCVPQFATVSKLVFVKNTSEHTLSYIWEKDFKKVFSVEPVEGYIQPGKSAACKLTFSSASLSCNYKFDQTCKIIDESELVSHEAAMCKWKEKNEDEKYALLITDSSQQNTSRTAFHKKLVTRGRFSTLPPIGETQQTYEEWKMSDLSTKSKKRPISKKTVERGPPMPPAPFVLHLHIRANSVSIFDYLKLHQDCGNHDIDCYTLGLENESVCCVQQDELDFLKFVLNQITKEVLGDYDFQTAVGSIIKEAIPQFSQFSQTSADWTLITQEHFDWSNYQQNSCCSNEDISICVNGIQEISNDELNSIVDGTMKDTLLNVFIEANSGEFSVDNPLCTITKSKNN